jgi:hypothetical protein
MINKLINLSEFDYFLLLVIVNLVLIPAAIVYYNGTFLFWQYPFSSAGDAFSQSGLLNTTGSRIYSLNMILSGSIMLFLSRRFDQGKNEHKNNNRAILSFICGLGFLIASFSPDDTRHQFHVLGSALAIASLWLMATGYLFEIAKNLQPRVYILFQSLLQIPIIAYAGAYFLKIDPTSYVLQKFALVGLFTSLLFSSNTKRKYIKKQL